MNELSEIGEEKKFEQKQLSIAEKEAKLEFLKQNLFKILVTVPAIFAVVGTIIINASLRQYGIEDFYIISSKNLIVGAMFFIIHFAFFYFYAVFLDLNNLLNNRPIHLFLNAIIKPFLFLAFFSQLFLQDYSIISDGNRYGVSTSLCLIVIAITQQEYIREWRTERLGVLSLAVLVPSLIYVIFFVGLSCVESSDIRKIFFYFLSWSLILWLVMQNKWAILDDRFRGVENPDHTFFSKEKVFTIHDLLLSLVLFLVPFFCLIFSYSAKIYPHLPSVIGGAAQKNEVLISLKDKNLVRGKIVHSNQESIFLTSDETRIIKCDFDEIESIKVVNKRY